MYMYVVYTWAVSLFAKELKVKEIRETFVGSSTNTIYLLNAIYLAGQDNTFLCIKLI